MDDAGNVFINGRLDDLKSPTTLGGYQVIKMVGERLLQHSRVRKLFNRYNKDNEGPTPSRRHGKMKTRFADHIKSIQHLCSSNDFSVDELLAGALEIDSVCPEYFEDGLHSTLDTKLFVIFDEDDYIQFKTQGDVAMIEVNAHSRHLVKGMLGTRGRSGLIGRDGETVMESGNAMGDEWQVRDTDAKLFHTARAPQYPDKCIMPEPEEGTRRLGEEKALRRLAMEACSNKSPTSLEFCIFDVIQMEDEAAADMYD
jgi:hypothetical protein